MALTNSNQRIAKNTIFLYVRLAVAMVVNLYVTRILLDVLGVSDYGVYNVVCGFVSMFGFLNTSMANGIQRFYNYELGKNGEDAVVKVYNTALIIQIILVVGIVVLTETIGLWYVNTRMVISPDRDIAANLIFQFAVVSLIFVVLQIPFSAAIMAYERMDYYAIVSILDVFIKLGIVLILPQLSGDRLVLYGFLIMLVSAINFILYYVYCRKHLKLLKFKRVFDKSLFKSMISFSSWNLLGSFAYIVKGQGVNVLINAFFNTVINAANGIATQVSSAIQTFSTNLAIAFKPQLTQSYSIGDYKRAELLMLSMSKISYVFVCIMAIPIIIEIDFVLDIWLKTNIPEHTTTFTKLTIIAMMIGVLNTPITQMIHASGQMKKYQIVTSITICSILPISWIFLKLGYDAASVFIVTIIIMTINQVASLQVLHSIFKFNIQRYIKEVVLTCIILTIVPFLIAYCIHATMTSSFTRFTLVFLANVLTAAILTYMTMSKSEKKTVQSYIKKFKNNILYKLQ